MTADYIRIALDVVILTALVLVTVIFLSRCRGVKKLSAGLGSAKVELDLSGMDEQTQAVFKTMWKRFDELKATLEESKRQYKEIALKNSSDLLNIQENISELSSKVNSISIDNLKMMFYSETLDAEEKLCAGLRYVSAGFNHTIKRDVIFFGLANAVIYRSLTLARPEWKVDEIEVGIEC